VKGETRERHGTQREGGVRDVYKPSLEAVTTIFRSQLQQEHEKTQETAKMLDIVTFVML
jgi:hypothetical protein